MARSLPADWDVELTLVGGGAEALEAIRAGQGDVLFLDLNMPEPDGYQVLEAIRREDLPTLVIVVSGDIQPEAHERVRALGAMAFVKKPVDSERVGDILNQYGLFERKALATREIELEVDAWDCYREIANIASGRAADLLARLLDAFVLMPVPKVAMIEASELRMALSAVQRTEKVSAVCQGFIGAGLAGEAFLLFSESSYTDMAELMHFEGELDDATQLELLMDVSSILIGACLTGIFDQLDLKFSQGHPMVLGRHVSVSDLMRRNAPRWHRMLAIEIGYQIEMRNVTCDLLLLFTEDSLERLNHLAAYIAD
jgi:chemotaxis protein CheY-P-specific phosphatase CheC